MPAAKILSSATCHLSVSPAFSQLSVWLARQLEVPALDWLDQTLKQLQDSASERLLFSRFSAAPRQVGKADLTLTDADCQTASDVREGWNPVGWSVDQVARTLLLLAFAGDDADAYVAGIEKLFSAADVAEQVALYQSLPLLPYPERFVERAVEGLRSNITAVFNAIALRNPYPADSFDQSAWNQMVLKALFVDSRLSQIWGLEARANPKLAQMLSDYAHERWAAGRTVNPQLWRAVGPCAADSLIADFERVLESGEPFEQEAVALACANAQDPKAQALLSRVPDLHQQIADRQLTWGIFSQHHA